MEKYGITIYRNGLVNESVELFHILEILGESGRNSVWRLDDVEFNGDCSELFHDVSDTIKCLSGSELYQLSQGFCQMLDGTLTAFRIGQSEPWLLIRSIRGDEFDIETQDTELLERIRKSFPKVEELIY